jgi:hypothetical protein
MLPLISLFQRHLSQRTALFSLSLSLSPSLSLSLHHTSTTFQPSLTKHTLCKTDRTTATGDVAWSPVRNIEGTQGRIRSLCWSQVCSKHADQDSE